MPERFCRIGEVDLCFETFGAPSDPTVLLVMGLGTQMIGWHDEFCAGLAGRGFNVVRFDNRDTGRSSRMSGAPPTPVQLLRRSREAARYTLDDMAGDAVGLLDHLDVGSAHVVGASMGAMIAQTVAVLHPQRVRSLVSIMGSTGSRWVGQPAMSLYPIFLRRPPRDREAYIEHAARLFARIGSPGRRRDDADVRQMAARSFDRGLNPAGTGRQLAAILSAGDRTERMRSITAPTLVIHGRHDRLVSSSGGRATARAIPGARLELIDEMGHDLPRDLWPRLLDLIEGHMRAADERAGAAPAAAVA